MIEKDFEIPFIADLARREKQIQQNYRPIIAVHKWFARRPGTLFRGLILSEFSEKSLQEVYYTANNFSGLHIADPFMGGGIPVLESNRVGCDVTGFDINPMSYWIVKQEIGHLHKTACTLCGSQDAHVKYFLWVKVIPCKQCGELSLAGRSLNNPKYEVIACIGGRGFGVRREDMKKMILATRGKVFTAKTLAYLVECTEIKKYKANQ